MNQVTHRDVVKGVGYIKSVKLLRLVGNGWKTIFVEYLDLHVLVVLRFSFSS